MAERGPDYRKWRRLVKLDPARPLSEERLEAVSSWDADAIIVGGSGGYGPEEVRALQARLRHHAFPLALEVSDLRAVCPGFDLYLVPMVLNSSEIDWVLGHHQRAIKRYAEIIDWRLLVVEGYCILNADAAAAHLSHARTDLEIEDVIAFAQVAEHLLRLPVFYLEYSGKYGSVEIVTGVRQVLDETSLWYGGGIRTSRQAREMGALADAIVVGNAVYEGYSPLPGG